MPNDGTADLVGEMAGECIVRLDTAHHPAAVKVQQDREGAGAPWRVDAYRDRSVRPGNRTVLDPGHALTRRDSIDGSVDGSACFGHGHAMERWIAAGSLSFKHSPGLRIKWHRSLPCNQSACRYTACIARALSTHG